MKKTMFVTSILVGSLFTGVAMAGSVKDIVPEVQAAAANPTVISAVKAQNAQGLTLAKIKDTDQAWLAVTKAGKPPTDFMKSYVSNAAAKALTGIEKSKPYLVEFILTDNQGANVAVTDITSDYWQGDEPKFANSYADGKGATYIARPQRDKSTGEVISQVSVPVMSDGKAIGTLTVGVRINKLK